MGQLLRIEASGLILGALALLILPMDWFLSVATAMCIHELGHFLCAKLLGVSVISISISAGGCVMETGPMTRRQEFLCALAGPLASFMLLCFRKSLPLIACCGLIQGIFNLLPVYPMDGGRILRAAAGERSAEIVSWITAVFLTAAGIQMTVLQNMGPVPGIFGSFLLIRHLKSKYFLQTGQTHSTIGLPIFKR